MPEPPRKGVSTVTARAAAAATARRAVMGRRGSVAIGEEDPSFRVLVPVEGDAEDLFEAGRFERGAGVAVGGEAALVE
jgi:hypothetical protein